MKLLDCTPPDTMTHVTGQQVYYQRNVIDIRYFIPPELAAKHNYGTMQQGNKILLRRRHDTLD